MNWTEFFHMGGYAFYVLTSWGLAVFILLALFISAKRGNRRIKNEIRRQLAREEKFSHSESI